MHLGRGAGRRRAVSLRRRPETSEVASMAQRAEGTEVEDVALDGVGAEDDDLEEKATAFVEEEAGWERGLLAG